MDEMKKYIIEFSEDPYTIRLLKIKNGDECPTTEFKTVTPYTEPDFEQIKKLAYAQGYSEGFANAGVNCYEGCSHVEEAYQRGAEDMREALKLLIDCDDDCLTIPDIFKAFGEGSYHAVVRNHPVMEILEKIRQYKQEQEQKQEICIGDEIITTSGLYAICSNIDNIKEGWVYLFFDDGSCGAHKIGEIKKKTGKNYPEIVTLLQGMTKA